MVQVSQGLAEALGDLGLQVLLEAAAAVEEVELPVLYAAVISTSIHGV